MTQDQNKDKKLIKNRKINKILNKFWRNKF